MDDENLIPRVRIHDDNFSEAIKKPLYPQVGFFIEVVNGKDEVIAIFYHDRPLVKTEFYDVFDYAKYYDTLMICRFLDVDWIHFSENHDLVDAKTIEEMRRREHLYWEDTYCSGYKISVIAYGRLKYPLGLKEKYREKYIEVFSWNNEYIFTTVDLKFMTWNPLGECWLPNYKNYPDDPIEYLNFSLNAIKTQVTNEEFKKTITFFLIEDILDKGLDFIKGIAVNLLTEDNIKLFIEETKMWGKNEILDYLLEYQSMHFPFAKQSQELEIFGIGRIKLLESDSPRCVPTGKNEFFVELIDSEGITKALVFIVDSSRKLFDMNAEFDSIEWDEFVAESDIWLTPNYLWKDIEPQRWVSESFGDEQVQAFIKSSGVDDINELEYDKFPDELLNLWSEYSEEPENTILPAIFLMAYGRLKYPYNLAKEIHDNCELYVRGFVKKRNLIGEFTDLTKDPKDIAELFNFCKNVFPDEETFREAYINQNSITELVRCDPEIFTAIADSILCIENVDRFLDEAHTQNKPELKAFLLDYKNKHFPADGQQTERLS